MDITWTYWKSSESATLKSIIGVCTVAEHELQCEINSYPDEAMAKKDIEKLVNWALNNEESVKRHILEQHYFDIIWTCHLYEAEGSVESADELRALVGNGQNIGVEPFASRESMTRYLRLTQIVCDYEYDGFLLQFVPTEDELNSSMGGHGPSISVGDDFSIGEFDWSG